MQTETLRFILGDQLSFSISSLDQLNKEKDVVFMCEVLEEATYVKHHKQKIIFILSAMRHFAAALKKKEIRVHYIKLDDPKNTGSLEGELSRALLYFKPKQLVMTEPGEYRVLEKIQKTSQKKRVNVDIRTDTRFLCTKEEFATWFRGKKTPRMEYFYREMRVRKQLLMDSTGKPIGGQWNYDKENRHPIKQKIIFPERPKHSIDTITANIYKLINKKFSMHFGLTENFHWAVTHKAAEKNLIFFIQHCLPWFGEYQDAMQDNEAFLFHSLISPYLNIGLLDPLEVCKQAEAAWFAGHAPLNAAEGFIRQILGWREYIRGIYWLHMPEYAEKNFLNATHKLPTFYWHGNTTMHCLREVIEQTKQYAYSHHIQRLMITGNFALLAGINPKAVCEWYLTVYADAFEWVELPNTLGMALFGDGGLLASKPYAASGKYIQKMSNFCQKCQFNPDQTTGESACPFNYLYWHFLRKNEEKFKKHPRMRMMYAILKKMNPEKKEEITKQAEKFLQELK